MVFCRAKHRELLFLDGVYVDGVSSVARFRWVKAQTYVELTQLAHTIAHRIARYLERQGLLARDAEHGYLALDGSDEDPMDQLRGHSITYRVAVGSQQGCKVFTLQTLHERDSCEPSAATVGQVAGFSLHAGVAAKAQQRNKLERLCRYITKPAVSEKRLALAHQGEVRYEQKTPYRDGTTLMIFESVDLIARLAALIPRPRVNLTPFHGVFASFVFFLSNTSSFGYVRYRSQAVPERPFSVLHDVQASNRKGQELAGCAPSTVQRSLSLHG